MPKDTRPRLATSAALAAALTLLTPLGCASRPAGRVTSVSPDRASALADTLLHRDATGDLALPSASMEILAAAAREPLRAAPGDPAHARNDAALGLPAGRGARYVHDSILQFRDSQRVINGRPAEFIIHRSRAIRRRLP